jgi:hypothetical protein
LLDEIFLRPPDADGMCAGAEPRAARVEDARAHAAGADVDAKESARVRHGLILHDLDA